MRYVLALVLVVVLLAACGDPQVIVIEREVVAATATSPSGPTPVAVPTETPTSVPTARPLSPMEIIKRARASVVLMVGSGAQSTGCASGVMLGQSRRILTNHHFVDGKDTIYVRTDNGSEALVHVLRSDATHDLALVQAASTLPEPRTMVWGDDRKLELGAELFVLGYPLCSPGEGIKVTKGIFSGRTRFFGQPVLQTDAALNSGVSGGLVVTADGTPIGIAVEGLPDRDNVGFIIPSSVIQAQIKRWGANSESGRITSPVRVTATPRPTATPRRHLPSPPARHHPRICRTARPIRHRRLPPRA